MTSPTDTATAPAAAASMLRAPEVATRVGARHITTLYRWIAEGRFPRPARIGRRSVAWPSCVIDRWIAEREAEVMAAWKGGED